MKRAEALAVQAGTSAQQPKEHGMDDQEQATTDRADVNRYHTTRSTLLGAIDVLRNLEGLCMNDVTLTSVPSLASSGTASFSFHVDATNLTARDVLARSASLQSTRSGT